MRYYDYSQTQLEEKARELTEKFDKERLVKPKELDVYDVVEFIGAIPDWLYLTPAQAYLGATVFNDSYWWAWPDSHYVKGMIPTMVPVKAGTILIDRTVNEGDNRGVENFTVMHECFHFMLHKKCFRSKKNHYQHYCKKEDFKAVQHEKRPMGGIEITEYQANYCAAAFLMPKDAVTKIFLERLGMKAFPISPVKVTAKVDAVISEMAEMFSVNYSPMKYRLQALKLISNESVSFDEYLC